ncbi:MAG TPA: malic enzyme-like NAD(P)-binding protein, partial [Candidatus Limnocylindrales bacterium]
PAWFVRQGLGESDLAEPVAVARGLGATILMGTTGARGAFTRPLVETIAAQARTPIVLPLSNPTDRAEATASDVLAWTAGRAIVATGSPSDAVSWDGRTRIVGQANNVFVFPGIGLGAIVASAAAIPDDAFLVAARTLASVVSDERLAAGAIYPSIADLRPVSRAIAIAVATALGRTDDVAAAVEAAMWQPDYLPYVPG